MKYNVGDKVKLVKTDYSDYIELVGAVGEVVRVRDGYIYTDLPDVEVKRFTDNIRLESGEICQAFVFIEEEVELLPKYEWRKL